MSLTVLLTNALRLPVRDWAALTQGQIIVAMPRKSIFPGLSFVLVPDSRLTPDLPAEEYYRLSYPSVAQDIAAQSESNHSLLRFWARCEFCKVLDQSSPLDLLSRSTIWTKAALEAKLSQQQYLFWAYLRVYGMNQLSEVIMEAQDEFVPLVEPLMVADSLPILSDYSFEKRKQRLENFEQPEHPELEELYSAIAQSADLGLVAQALEDDIRLLLGWTIQPVPTRPESGSSWITTIASVGNSSDGQTFEKLVRKSLIQLGFTNSRNDPKASLDPEATGGAGGIDFYCDAPYPVVGECKATKTEKVPSKTPGQLIHLGKNHLQNDYDPCIKLIVAAGDLTTDAELTTVNNQMNVLRPETLQRLVELKTRHPGAVDLLDLKPHLENSPFGVEADVKVNRYIDKVWQQLKIRSHVVQSVKHLTKPERKHLEVVEIRTCYNLKFADESDSEELDTQTIHELLIELSSPLAGYLGRIRGSSLSSDRFYFLRDFVV